MDLGRPVDGSTYIRIYDAGGVTAGELARAVARCTADLWTARRAIDRLTGQSRFSRVSIGTGAITPYLECVERFAIDLAICTDDGIDYWRDGGFAIDMDIPIIVVNHMVSEEIGVQRLAETLSRRFPDDSSPPYQSALYVSACPRRAVKEAL